MLNKSSQALLAALAVIAAPAFAQDTATTPPADTTGTETPAPAATETPTETGTSEPAPAETTETTDEAATTDVPADADASATDAPATSETAPADGAATTTETPAPDAATPAPTDPAAAAAPAADAAPKAGSYYVKSTHSDWTMRCVKAEQGKDPCELYQLMKDSEGNSVAEMTLIPLQNGDVAAGATLVAPLETDLIEGLGLAVDGGKPRGYPFSFCAPVGCVSRMGFTTAELGALKRGNKAVVSLLPFGADPKKPVQLNLSLAGFTAGFDEITAYAKAPAAEADANAEAEEEPANN